jgi:conserved oligomeric Golgi complex subunit 1
VYTLSRILREYWRICPSSDQEEAGEYDVFFSCSRANASLDANQMSPNYSSALTHSLLALSTALQELGIITDSPRRDGIIKQTLYQFLDTLTKGEVHRMEHGHRRNILFLQKLLDEWDSNWLESAGPLRAKLKDLTVVCYGVVLANRILTNSKAENAENEKDKLSSYLAGTQTLLASLFPRVKHEVSAIVKGDKKSALLRHGIPTAAQDIQPSIDIVKPSPRFGLLLVGGADIR